MVRLSVISGGLLLRSDSEYQSPILDCKELWKSQLRSRHMFPVVSCPVPGGRLVSCGHRWLAIDAYNSNPPRWLQWSLSLRARRGASFGNTRPDSTRPHRTCDPRRRSWVGACSHVSAAMCAALYCVLFCAFRFGLRPAHDTQCRLNLRAHDTQYKFSLRAHDTQCLLWTINRRLTDFFTIWYVWEAMIWWSRVAARMCCFECSVLLYFSKPCRQHTSESWIQAWRLATS